MRRKICCSKCDSYIGTFDEDADLTHYHGLNHGVGGQEEYECRLCCDRRRQRYDDYVDPLNFYH